MPAITRWYIKTSLVYFILALIAGLFLAAQNLWKSFLPLIGLFPAYIHLLVEGWITMLIIGVAIWMFPKYSREQPRGNVRLGWASYILLNAGLVLRVISEPVVSPAAVWGILLIVAALLQWLGGMAFVFNTWSRVKEK